MSILSDISMEYSGCEVYIRRSERIIVWKEYVKEEDSSGII
jgi:hypothetical protein